VGDSKSVLLQAVLAVVGRNVWVLRSLGDTILRLWLRNNDGEFDGDSFLLIDGERDKDKVLDGYEWFLFIDVVATGILILKDGNFAFADTDVVPECKKEESFCGDASSAISSNEFSLSMALSWNRETGDNARGIADVGLLEDGETSFADNDSLASFADCDAPESFRSSVMPILCIISYKLYVKFNIQKWSKI
jgi:hypothetical protein